MRGLSLFLCIASTVSLFGQQVDAEKIEKFEKASMLFQAADLAKNVSGKKDQWQHEYSKPVQIGEKGSCWLTAYPLSMIVPAGTTALKMLASEHLWTLLEEIGIDVLHTGPMKLAGHMENDKIEPSVDGGYDRIGYGIDPLFGTQYEYVEMVRSAKRHNAVIAGDLIPGHTGIGPDFLLATMNYKGYPGIYHMVEIEEKDWDYLPPAEKESFTSNLNPAQVDQLKKMGYIAGQLDKVYFYDPKVKETNWSVTKQVLGVDGKMHRWVYLHLFKAGQPTLNWLDPTFGANRIIAGDVVISLGNYQNTFVRLDANAFLGQEKVLGDGKSLSCGHPLSLISSDMIAMLARKLGGLTFQELDGSIDMIKDYMRLGPDLSYDFITRGAYLHALAFQNADALRLAGNLLKKDELPQHKLIHALQNHDEFNVSYNFLGLTPHKLYSYQGKQISGATLQNTLMQQDLVKLAGPNVPYNKNFDSGIATTLVGIVAASLGIGNIYDMTTEQKKMVKHGHLLLTFYNAMQPGVFALSAWDLLGALPLKENQVKSLVSQDNDTRWINRGAYDLIGNNSEVNESIDNIPRAQTLYDPLPIQLRSPCSYASLLKKILAARKEYSVDQATFLENPETKPHLYIAFYSLPRTKETLMVALNFSTESQVETVTSDLFENKQAFEIVQKKGELKKHESKEFQLNLGPLQAKAILFK